MKLYFSSTWHELMREKILKVKFIFKKAHKIHDPLVVIEARLKPFSLCIDRVILNSTGRTIGVFKANWRELVDTCVCIQSGICENTILFILMLSGAFVWLKMLQLYFFQLHWDSVHCYSFVYFCIFCGIIIMRSIL